MYLTAAGAATYVNIETVAWTTLSLWRPPCLLKDADGYCRVIIFIIYQINLVSD